MSELKDLEQILRAYTQKKKSPSISRYNLERYAAHWAGEFRKTRPGFTDFSSYTTSKYSDILDEAQEEGICLVKPNETGTQQIIYLRFYPYLVRKIYEDADEHPESSFPNEDLLGEAIPDAAVEVIQVKDQLVGYLGDIKKHQNTVFRFLFPEGVRSMIVIGEIMQSRLLSMCIVKLRSYLTLQKNTEYVQNKMYGIFSKKEQSVKDLFSNIMTQKDVAVKTLTDPDDFTFQFWTHLSSLIVGEFREKTNKLDREHGFSQAGYLLGLYALYYKGLKKRKLEKEQTLRYIDQGIKKAPYYHTFTDLYGLKDKVGLPISKKISQQELAQYLERRTRREKDGPMKEILRVVTSNKNEYYIAKERILNLILQRAQQFSREVREQYIKEWADALGAYKKLSIMNRRDVFQKDLWSRIKEQDPLLARMLTYELIFITLKESKPPREVYIEANRVINEKQSTLIPIDDILRLDQRQMIRDARTYLPLWKSIPVIGRIGVFFGRLFKRLAKGAESIKDPSDLYASMRKSSERGAAPAPEAYQPEQSPPLKSSGVKQLGDAPSKSQRRNVAQQVEFKKAIYELKQKYLGPEDNIQQTLEDLIEEWNPLVDSKAKQNLVEDVNSAVRDFIRKIKRNLLVKPPDEARIKNLSKQVAEYEAFKRIKNKDSFRTYIELYMLKILSLR